MKHLLLTLLFSASLAAFSQDKPQKLYLWPDGKYSVLDPGTPLKPDTLRAYILVTMCRKCAAEPRMGYVVIEAGKRPAYLDCRKRALKYPQVGWGYELVDPNYKQ